MKRSTREWVRKAEGDVRATERLIGGTPPLRDQLCFHCQQAAEKYLKALLEELGLFIPKTHDLEDLLDLLLPRHPGLRQLRRSLRPLTPFAVAIRYPGDNATKRQAAAAPRWAAGTRDACRAILGLPTP